MSAQPLPEPGGECPLCRSDTPLALDRCPECGLALDGVGGRPGPFSWRVLTITAMGFLAVYLITLGVVALTN